MTDTAAVDRMGSLFNDFLAAAEAIKQRPQLEAKVADAEAQRDRAKAEAQFANDRLEDEQIRNDALRAKVAQLEADLAQATFREKEARDNLGLVVDTLKGAMSNAKAAIELVEPPVVEPPSPVEASTTTELPGAYPWNEPVPPNPTMLSTGDIAPASDIAPTVEASPYGTPQAAAPVPVEDTASKPYSDKPYWVKPDAVSWKTWTEGGGDKAPWIKETDWEWANTYPSGSF